MKSAATTIVGLVLILVGVMALLGGVDSHNLLAAPAQRVVWTDSNGTTEFYDEFDEKELERRLEAAFAEIEDIDFEELEGLGERIARDLEDAFANLDLEFAIDADPDHDSRIRIHGGRDDGFSHRVHINGEQIGRHLSRAMAELEHNLSNLEINIEGIDDDHGRWSRRHERSERELRREIRDLERQLRRLTEELDDLVEPEDI